MFKAYILHFLGFKDMWFDMVRLYIIYCGLEEKPLFEVDVLMNSVGMQYLYHNHVNPWENVYPEG